VDRQQTKTMKPRLKHLLLVPLVAGLAVGGLASAQAKDKKPTIVVIFANDVGIWNISAYHRGTMGGSTPNIDRFASLRKSFRLPKIQ
jgi:hypothetical protein